MKSIGRTPEQIKRHYDVEVELANRLRNASRDERQALYSTVYDELFRRVPDHPQLAKKQTPEERLAEVLKQKGLIDNFLKPDSVYVEVGAGDCALTFEVARDCAKAYAVDVSSEIMQTENKPDNVEHILCDGSSIPLPDAGADVAYSNQLMEHLHPDDALDQMKSILALLRKGGVYICVTPNRLNGPHDVSKFFDPVATGFHMKEYTTVELRNLFAKVGFSRVDAWCGAKGKYARVPFWLVSSCEGLMRLLPRSVRRRVANMQPFKILLGICVVGTK